MECSIRDIPGFGRVLWMTDGCTEAAAALEYGIRIVHLSCAGMENLFYCQPEDLSDGLCTEQGWRIRGGHRLWLAPESEKSYHPDNEPVAWSREEDGVLLTQTPDPELGVRKSVRLTFAKGGGLQVEHRMENISQHAVEGALWAVSTVDGGGTASVAFGGPEPGGYSPRRLVSLWGDTCLHDGRLQFFRDRLTARHLPLDPYCKLGLYSREGRAVLENKGQRLELTFGAEPMERYPDCGCNFELYLDRNVMELETLGTMCRLEPGQQAAHLERWRVTPCPDGRAAPASGAAAPG